MRKRNYPLRLQPSLMEEAREAAKTDRVTLNNLFNVAVAEKLSALRTSKYLQKRIDRANREETIRILDQAGKANLPKESADLPLGVPDTPVESSSLKIQPAAPPDEQHAGQKLQAFGRANPQFGLLKIKLDKFRNR